MPLDAPALAAALGTEPPATVFHHLCRSQCDDFLAAAGDGPVLVACGQEAPLFVELARRAGAAEPLCVDIRDRAGWSSQADAAGPKIAALLAEALVESGEPTELALAAEGSVLVIGKGQEVLEAAARLCADHAVTCLLTLDHEPDLLPPAVRALGLFRGRPVRASGGFGTFRLSVAELAGASPSARGGLSFEASLDERELAADIILDLSGRTPLLPPRDGMLRVEPGDRVGFERALAVITGLTNGLRKPRWIKVDATLCAHARNGQVGCTRCLDSCPAGALRSAGNAVAVDEAVCGGHGACASVCPTGAIRFDGAGGHALFARMAALLETHRAAGGADPLLVVHDAAGAEVISALARFGDGLPARALPLEVAAPAALGPDFVPAALAKGAADLLILVDPARRDDLCGVRAAIEMGNSIARGLGWSCRARLEVEADPMAVSRLLTSDAGGAVAPAAEFLVLGGLRQTLSMALAHLHRHAPAPVDHIPLAAGDCLGTIAVDEERCTLCMACVVACPPKALAAGRDKPSLSIVEAQCVQCGLCRSTCPEKAVTLVPRAAFGPQAKLRTVLKEEEPYPCIRCGTPFAPRSTVERMVERMRGHSMFQAPGRLDLIRMCDACRGAAQREMGPT